MNAVLTCGVTLAAALAATVTIGANGKAFAQPGEAFVECLDAADRRACEARARAIYRSEAAKARSALDKKGS